MTGGRPLSCESQSLRENQPVQAVDLAQSREGAKEEDDEWRDPYFLPLCVFAPLRENLLKPATGVFRSGPRDFPDARVAKTPRIANHFASRFLACRFRAGSEGGVYVQNNPSMQQATGSARLAPHVNRNRANLRSHRQVRPKRPHPLHRAIQGRGARGLRIQQPERAGARAAGAGLRHRGSFRGLRRRGVGGAVAGQMSRAMERACNLSGNRFPVDNASPLGEIPPTWRRIAPAVDGAKAAATIVAVPRRCPRLPRFPVFAFLPRRPAFSFCPT